MLWVSYKGPYSIVVSTTAFLTEIQALPSNKLDPTLPHSPTPYGCVRRVIQSSIRQSSPLYFSCNPSMHYNHSPMPMQPYILNAKNQVSEIEKKGKSACMAPIKEQLPPILLLHGLNCPSLLPPRFHRHPSGMNPLQRIRNINLYRRILLLSSYLR